MSLCRVRWFVHSDVLTVAFNAGHLPSQHGYFVFVPGILENWLWCFDRIHHQDGLIVLQERIGLNCGSVK